MNEWKEYRVKDVAYFIGSGTTPTSGNDKYYENGVHHWINTGDLNNSEVFGGKKTITDLALREVSSLRFYPVDTVLVAMYGASIGKTGLLKVKATVNQACCAIVPNNQIVIPEFLFYRITDYKDKLISESFGGTQPNVSQTIVANIKLTFPSVVEQQQIVSYLDTKTAAIDKRIAVLEKKQEVYSRLRKSIINRAVTRGLNPNVPLKDSGIDWIGMIPEHWEVVRGKDLGEIAHGISYTPSDLRDEKDGTLVLRASNIQSSQICLEDNVYIDNNRIPSSKKIKLDDIIICSTNGSLALVGKSAVIKENIDASFGSFMLRLRTDQDAMFIHHQLSVFVDLYRGLFSTTTINQLTIGQLEKMRFFLPPLPEQRAIADYLDEKWAKINAAVENIGKQIDALKRLKRALINEVVTGKRKV